MKKLNVASGKDIRKGWDNLDNHKRYGANIIWDLNKLPLPFKNESYDYILCSYYLEHLNDCFPLMNEFIRILKRNGTLELIVPYGDSTWDSIDHKRQFFVTTFFDFLTDGNFEDKGAKYMKIKNYQFISNNKGCWIRMKIFFYNSLLKIHPKIIDYTILKLFTSYLNLKVIYTKTKGFSK